MPFFICILLADTIGYIKKSYTGAGPAMNTGVTAGFLSQPGSLTGFLYLLSSLYGLMAGPVNKEVRFWSNPNNIIENGEQAGAWKRLAVTG